MFLSREEEKGLIVKHPYCSLPVWRSSLEKGLFIDVLWPCPGSALGGFGPKVNTNVGGHEYFIPTKFGKYPLNDSVVKADYVFPYINMHSSAPPSFHLNKWIKIH